MADLTKRIGLKIAYILLAAGSFAVFLAALVLPLRPVGYALDQWQEKHGDAWRPVRLPAFEMYGPQPTTMELRTSFPAVDADTLVIPRQSGNAIEIRLNGRVIYSLGDFTQPTANLWNYVQVVKLAEPLQPENELEIRLVSSYYSSGLNAVPYLSRYSQAAGRVAFLNWLYNDFLAGASGAALVIGLILFALAAIRQTRWSVEFWMGLALVFGAFYILDMQFRISSGSLATFLWLKKGILLSGYLASLFFLCGLEKYVWDSFKISRWLAGLTALTAALILAAPNPEALGLVTNGGNAVLLINLLVAVALIVGGGKFLPWMLVPATWLMLSVLQMLLSIPLNITWPLMSPYALLVTTILVGTRLILETNQLHRENLVLQRIKNIDPLTGVMNRRFLAEQRENRHRYIVMIDLDYFKGINDRFGHAFGDQMLVRFAEVARQNLRPDDIVVRLGGDEFALMLDCGPLSPIDPGEVERIIGRIQAQNSSLYPHYGLDFSYGIAPINGSVERALEEADRQMYQMKEQKKARRAA